MREVSQQIQGMTQSEYRMSKYVCNALIPTLTPTPPDDASIGFQVKPEQSTLLSHRSLHASCFSASVPVWGCGHWFEVKPLPKASPTYRSLAEHP